MEIKITKDKSQNLTIHEVTGPIVEVEMLDILENFYKQEPTRLLLWDMSRAEVSKITPDMLRRLIQISAGLGTYRQGGRTAVVASMDLQFGLARMSAAFAEIESVTYNLQVFRTREEALQWLKL